MTYKYPNVVFDFTAKVPEGAVMALQPMMADLIDTLAVKYAGWQFIAVDGKYTDEHCNRIEAHNFRVMDDSNPRKEIGAIGIHHRYVATSGRREVCYSIQNRRISHSRSRGYRVVTKDKKLAIKTVANFFTPEPLADRLVEARQLAIDNITNRTHKRTASMNLHLATVLPHMQEFVYSHWDEFAATTSADVLDEATRVKTLQEEISGLESLQPKNQKSGKLLTVLIERDKYAVLHDGRVSVLDVDEVPPDMKRAIGMLKLNDVGAVLPGIGVRVANESFYIHVPDEV